jgi:Protein of unknown function (DUF1566)
MKKFKSILIGFVLLMLGVGVGRLSAGSPDAPGGPGDIAAGMYTMEQVYQRIKNGGVFEPATTFTEPSTAPGTGTMHTLNEIYNLIGMSAHVPRTTRNLCPCGSPGDDSELRMGVLWPSPRFSDNSNGSVTDNLTGLIWLKNANCFGTQTWDQALADANALASGQCSVTDGSTAGHWRLPNVRELLSLIDFGHASPAFPTTDGSPFSGLQASVRYWSSTVVANNGLNAWDIDFDIGTVNRNQLKTTAYYVWPVSGGQSNP